MPAAQWDPTSQAIILPHHFYTPAGPASSSGAFLEFRLRRCVWQDLFAFSWISYLPDNLSWGGSLPPPELWIRHTTTTKGSLRLPRFYGSKTPTFDPFFRIQGHGIMGPVPFGFCHHRDPSAALHGQGPHSFPPFHVPNHQASL